MATKQVKNKAFPVVSGQNEIYASCSSLNVDSELTRQAVATLP